MSFQMPLPAGYHIKASMLVLELLLYRQLAIDRHRGS
jgi:hypothetical protein